MFNMKITNKIVRTQARKFHYKGSLRELKMGLRVEQEHKDVVGNDIDLITKIALSHLRELPNYYTRLKRMGG